MTEKMRFETKDLMQENIAKIGQLFPEVLTETKDENGILKKVIDFDKLRQILSDSAIDNRETYDFTWVGKKQAILEAATPIRKTLRPCKEESVNWDTTQNLYIEGDNLDVLKLLQESYLGKVKMIYIDPPYNTGSDFIYKDAFVMSQEEYDESSERLDEEGNRLVKNTDANGRFHSDWCSMMYPRLKLARNLLAKDGIICVSIGEQEWAHLKEMLIEIFGAVNYIETYVWESTFRPDNSSKIRRRNVEFILCAARDIAQIPFLKGLNKASEGLPSLTKNSMKAKILTFPATSVTAYLKDGRYMAGLRNNYELLDDVEVRNGKIVNAFRLKGPMIWGQDNLNQEIQNGTEIIIKGENFIPYTKKQQIGTFSPSKLIPNNVVGDILEANKDINQLFSKKVFSYPKPVSLMRYLQNYIDDKDCIILDFFSGSSTTAQAVFENNILESTKKRKFILVQLPENLDDNLKKADDKEKPVIQNAIELCEHLKVPHTLCEIGKERIRRAAKQLKAAHPESNFDSGFRVFKLADSNMKDVYYNPAEYTQDLLDKMTSNIKEDRNAMDLLYGCMLEWGLPLSYPHTSEKVGSYTIHIVNNGDLVACFDENITEDIIRHIAAKKPLRVVFRDAGFADSPAKINVGELFKLLSPDTKVKVI